MNDMSAWFALGGALGGVTLTGLIGLATAALTHRWGERSRLAADHAEEIRTVRGQRREACHNYLVATNSYYQLIDQLHLKIERGENLDREEYTRSAITALQDKYVYLTISCGAAVRDLARTYNVALYSLSHIAQETDMDAWSKQESETHRVRRLLRATMRSELGVSDETIVSARSA
jgi:hypothetical protein